MVRLYEYQAKNILAKYGIKTPKGIVLDTSRPMEKDLMKIKNYPIVVKAQVLHGKRKEKGLIKVVRDADEAKKHISTMAAYIEKYTSSPKILVEEYKKPLKEYYISLTISNSKNIKGPILIFGLGGTGIEERSEKAIYIKHPIEYVKGIDLDQLKKKLQDVDIEKPSKILEIIEKAYKVFIDYDCRVVEINPLAYTREGYIALDARISIDDNSLYKHREFSDLIPIEMDREPTLLERIAYEIERNDYRGISYFIEQSTHGEGPPIGFHGIGGGGALIGLDILIKHGYRVANYSDTSGNPPASKIYRIAKVILSIPQIKAYVLVSPNIANQEMWYTAFGLVKAFREELREKPRFPVAILWGGNKAAEATKILIEKTRDLDLNIWTYTVDPIGMPEGDIYGGLEELANKLGEMIKEYEKHQI